MLSYESYKKPYNMHKNSNSHFAAKGRLFVVICTIVAVLHGTLRFVHLFWSPEMNDLYVTAIRSINVCKQAEYFDLVKECEKRMRWVEHTYPVNIAIETFLMYDENISMLIKTLESWWRAMGGVCGSGSGCHFLWMELCSTLIHGLSWTAPLLVCTIIFAGASMVIFQLRRTHSGVVVAPPYICSPPRITERLILENPGEGMEPRHIPGRYLQN